MTLTKVEATAVVEALLPISKEGCLEGGGDLLLRGVGKFSVKKKPRRGRNPQTGDALMLDARTVVTFKPSGILRDRINGEQSRGAFVGGTLGVLESLGGGLPGVER